MVLGVRKRKRSVVIEGRVFGREVYFHLTPAVVFKGVLFVAFIYALFAVTESQAGRPYLPVERWAETGVDWLAQNLAPVFAAISGVIENVLTLIRTAIFSVSPLVFGAVLAGMAVVFHSWRRGLFVALALAVIWLMHFWEPTLLTLSLTVTATLFAVVIGIPLGIAKAHIRGLSSIVDPVLDFMQTMPLFVYLIPAVLFFQIGDVPGVVATFIFAMPPAVRLTSLGIEQIPEELVEAGRAFGVSAKQFLLKVELPLATPSIMMGVNQSIMLALSMVVIAALIGAEGLGEIVVSSVQRVEVGEGLAGGLAVVLLAMILDRLTRRTT